ncbi:Regulatory protein FmdB Zinc ribbon domain-containing protein [Bordetella sputigena]|uniref:DUF1178 family protein n=1 Tax=Bordetella sputigena TaxID=1416810 RepID=UPI0039EE28CD
MKVFDLQCDEQGHLFEGWFASHENYDEQQARGLVSCPICGANKVSKRLSAPRLNVSHLKAAKAAPQPPAQSAPAAAAGEPADMARLQAAILQQVRDMVRKAENVGPRFAEEARRIHEGEADERPIRGTSTPEERQALAEEGIDFLALPDIFDDDRLQ